MKLRKVLMKLAVAIAEEAEKNPSFKEKLMMTLSSMDDKSKESGVRGREGTASENGPEKLTASLAHGEVIKRPGNRRAPALLDPVTLARESESQLRAALTPLSLDQLRDIVAEYGMDHGGLVMKWKTSERVADRIVEVAVQRARKGDAFRDQSEATSTKSN